MDLLQQVQSPHTPQRSDSLTEADEDLAIGAAPQRIASRRTKSELFRKSPNPLFKKEFSFLAVCVLFFPGDEMMIIIYWWHFLFQKMT